MPTMNIMQLPWPMEGESPFRLIWAGRSGLHSRGWGPGGGRGPLTHRQDIRNMFPIHFVFDSGSKTGSDC